ncbi:1302_t:CDS:1, partial [Racocetra fulgida]
QINKEYSGGEEDESITSNYVTAMNYFAYRLHLDHSDKEIVLY